TGALLADSFTKQSGSVSLVAPGTISATSVRTDSGNISGNIFVSSGGSTDPVVSLGNINTSSGAGASGVLGQIVLGANVAVKNGFQSNRNATISVARVNVGNTPPPDSVLATPQAYLFYNSGLSNTAPPTTISVTTSSVNIYPGGYASIGSAGSPV